MRRCDDVCVCVCVQAQGPDGAAPLKHQLLQVIVRVLQYRMLLTGTHLNTHTRTHTLIQRQE